MTGSLLHSPPPRQSGGLAYDSEDEEIVLFGGEHFNGETYVLYNDTWVFADGAWTNVSPEVSPSPRWGFQLADDPIDGCVVLFGGENAHGARLNDTWEFQGGTWTNVSATHAPPARFWGSMSFDSSLNEVVLFGGNEGSSPSEEYSNDTWAFSLGTWTELTPTHAPPGRDDQAQADDVADGTVVMFGGLNTTDYLNDSWTFAAGDWSAVAVGHGPGLRAGPGIAYDTVAGKVVVYGGTPASADYYYTWVYSAGSWTSYDLTPTPPAGTTWGQMAYDASDKDVILFQGNGDYNSTWTLNFSTGPTAPLKVSARASPTTANVNQTVSFTSTVSGGVPPYTFHWVFADGTGAGEQNSSHAYAAVGVYRATLYVNDSNHSSATGDVNVTVQHPASSNGPPILDYVGAAVGVAVVGIILAIVFGRRRRRSPTESPDPAAGTAPGPKPPA